MVVTLIVFFFFLKRSPLLNLRLDLCVIILGRGLLKIYPTSV